MIFNISAPVYTIGCAWAFYGMIFTLKNIDFEELNPYIKKEGNQISDETKDIPIAKIVADLDKSTNNIFKNISNPLQNIDKNIIKSIMKSKKHNLIDKLIAVYVTAIKNLKLD